MPVSVVDLGDGAYELVVKPTEGTGLYNVDVGLPAEGTQQIAPHSHLGSAPLEVKIDLGDGMPPPLLFFSFLSLLSPPPPLTCLISFPLSHPQMWNHLA